MGTSPIFGGEVCNKGFGGPALRRSGTGANCYFERKAGGTGANILKIRPSTVEPPE
jgi:hypothetical protein